MEQTLKELFFQTSNNADLQHVIPEKDSTVMSCPEVEPFITLTWVAECELKTIAMIKDSSDGQYGFGLGSNSSIFTHSTYFFLSKYGMPFVHLNDLEYSILSWNWKNWKNMKTFSIKKAAQETKTEQYLFKTTEKLYLVEQYTPKVHQHEYTEREKKRNGKSLLTQKLNNLKQLKNIEFFL